MESELSILYMCFGERVTLYPCCIFQLLFIGRMADAPELSSESPSGDFSLEDGEPETMNRATLEGWNKKKLENGWRAREQRKVEPKMSSHAS